jgi:hypothetical protein
MQYGGANYMAQPSWHERGAAYSLSADRSRFGPGDVDYSTFNKGPSSTYYDASTGGMHQTLDKNEAFALSYGIETPTNTSGPQSSYPIDVQDFPDGRWMPDKSDVFISRMQSGNKWVFEVMPMELTYRTDLAFSEVVFNDTAVDRAPEESVPTIVTQQLHSYSKQQIRWSKGAQMERARFLTPGGRRNFYCKHACALSLLSV